jgi:hypothetical protein
MATSEEHIDDPSLSIYIQKLKSILLRIHKLNASHTLGHLQFTMVFMHIS